jgi:transposase
MMLAAAFDDDISGYRNAKNAFRSGNNGRCARGTVIGNHEEAALFAAVGTKQGHRRHPDWGEIHRELKRKHVTLAMLWDEYIERHPGGYRITAGLPSAEPGWPRQ